jgi:uncharacterized delta-60 repeat protein
VKVSRLAQVLALACLGVLALAGSASAALRVDRSFGTNGIVKPSLPLSEAEFKQMVVGPAGSVYLLVNVGNCQPECSSQGSRVIRLRGDGSQDTSYGASPLGVYLGNSPGSKTIAVDAQGRVMAAFAELSRTVVERFDSAGNLDPSFGEAGIVRIDCACEGKPVLETDGEGRIVVGRNAQLGDYLHILTRSALYRWRLNADGSVDASFGAAGSNLIYLNEAAFPSASYANPSGATLLAGNTCCDYPNDLYMQRIATNGLLDRGFAARAQRAIAGITTPKGRRLSYVASVVPRSKGRFDLLGSTEGGRGFMLRFRSNGSLDSRFGKAGLKLLPLGISSAAVGKGGRVFGVGNQVDSGPGAVAFRLRPNGSYELTANGFRAIGLESWDAGQSTVAVERGKRPIVFETGFPFCRSYCTPDPRLIRFHG